MSPFIEWPLLAAVPGLLFLGWYRMLGRRWLAYSGIAWLVYAIYELGMRLRWLCTGECNIRIDLLLIYPVLALLTVTGIVSGARGQANARSRTWTKK